MNRIIRYITILTLLFVTHAHAIVTIPDGVAPGTTVAGQRQAMDANFSELDLEKIHQVANIQALRDYAGDATSVYVKGHTTAGDGGGGVFHKLSVGGYTDDNGVTIVPTGGDGSVAWVRNLDGFVHAKMFGAKMDGATDDTLAHQASLDYVGANLAITLKVLAGTTRVTDELSLVGSGVPIVIDGAGSSKTLFFGDFTDPSEAIIDLSNSNADSYSTRGHRIKGLGFVGRGLPGDPVGLKLLNAFDAHVEDIDAPFIDNKALANSAVFVTNDNNSKFINIRSQSGYQPREYEISNALVTLTAASVDVVATTGTPFTAGMVGKRIVFNKGGVGSHAIHSTTVASYTNSTSISITTAPTESATEVKVSVGKLTGTITSGTVDLVTNVALDENLVGSQIHIVGAKTVTDASNTKGLLSTTITGISGTAVTLSQPATGSVTDAAVFISPAIFLGTLEGDPSGRQVNHSWWINTHCEGYQAAGLIVNKAIYAKFDNCKIHGPGYATAPDWDQAEHSLVVSEAKTVMFNGVQSAHTVGGSPILFMGSRGVLTIRDAEFGHVARDVPYVLGVELTSAARINISAWQTYSLSGFTSGYEVVSMPAAGNYGDLLLQTRDGVENSIAAISGTFTTVDGKTITITNKKVTGIVE